VTSRNLGESIGPKAAKYKNRSILTYLMIFSLEGKDKICCHFSVFLIIPTPTHDNSLGVDLKISIFWFAYPTPSVVAL